MMDFSLWFTFVAASIALLMIPGPTVLLVLSYALAKGRAVAVSSALGVALGDLIAMAASLAGLGALLATSALAFTLLKWIGAAYLIWLGIKLIRSAKTEGLSLPEADEVTARHVFRHTALVTSLNPKSIAFFVAFVPQFISPTGAYLPQASVLLVTFVVLAAINALLYALAADRLRGWIARPSVIPWLTRAGGGTLIAMGILTAGLRRATP